MKFQFLETWNRRFTRFQIPRCLHRSALFERLLLFSPVKGINLISFASFFKRIARARSLGWKSGERLRKGIRDNKRSCTMIWSCFPAPGLRCHCRCHVRGALCYLSLLRVPRTLFEFHWHTFRKRRLFNFRSQERTDDPSIISIICHA